MISERRFFNRYGTPLIMDREQAVSVIKHIFEKCNQMQGKSMKLMPPKENNALSNTFQIHIQTSDDEILKSCIKSIAKENGLSVKQKDSLLIVYKPYPNVKETF